MDFEYSWWLKKTLWLVLIPSCSTSCLAAQGLVWPSAPEDLSSPNVSWLYSMCHIPSSTPVASAINLQRKTVFLFKIFYCYSITVVCIFSPSLHPTPANQNQGVGYFLNAPSQLHEKSIRQILLSKLQLKMCGSEQLNYLPQVPHLEMVHPALKPRALEEAFSFLSRRNNSKYKF